MLELTVINKINKSANGEGINNDVNRIVPPLCRMDVYVHIILTPIPLRISP